MRALRPVLLALMMVLMLPLGALNAWVPSVPADAAPLAQTAPQSAAQSQIRTCRSAFLPGAGCAKYLEGAGPRDIAGPERAAPAAPQQTNARMQTQPAPPQGPPRNM
ncbi:hypothetical protein [Roseibaca sp. Y0-43]|uniref:hypothetical protein n=1 Tax=Roseibaca sp. Y0-43 TaxID=2816854 RepID=UPI001D0C0B9A|nr:hypothetical protein [Roseibaca sp. Y0-43]MCC1482257.1 hypothetical protein [Roseibaca sp. Y0-43]